MTRNIWLVPLTIVGLILVGQKSAIATDLNRVQLKQGISIACPNDFKILDSKNVEALDKGAKGLVGGLRPKLKVHPNAVQILFAAADDLASFTRQVQVTIAPPERSQKELKALDAKQVKGLRDAMLKRAAPVFKKLDYKITKKMDSEVVKGDSLSYFFLGYEFTEATHVPQISLKGYFYTSQATIVVSFSCDEDYYTRHTEMIRNVLGSLATSEE